MFIHSPWVGKKCILLLLFILFVFREKWDDCSLTQAQEPQWRINMLPVQQHEPYSPFLTIYIVTVKLSECLFIYSLKIRNLFFFFCSNNMIIRASHGPLLNLALKPGLCAHVALIWWIKWSWRTLFYTLSENKQKDQMKKIIRLKWQRYTQDQREAKQSS